MTILDKEGRTTEFSIYKDQSTRWYLLGSLIAIEILMSVSFLGYIHIAPISVTFAYIPILVTGCLMGPGESTAVGAVFGLISMWKASATYVLPSDAVFSPVMSGAPVRSILLSVGTRALFGLLVGLLYYAVKKRRRPEVWLVLLTLCGRVLHSLLVYSALGLLFPELGYGPANTLNGLGSPINLAVSAGSAVVVLLCWRLSRSAIVRRFEQRMALVKRFQLMDTYHGWPLAVLLLVMFGFSCAVTVYFVWRIRYMFAQQQDLVLSDEAMYNLLLLQAQFLAGMIALTFLLVVFQVFNRRYTTYMNYEAKLDMLTGLYNRKHFFQMCSELLGSLSRRADEAEYGFFLMIDIDWFKQINDTFGHPEGDRVLRGVAGALRDVFSPVGVVGRLGGDEFAVFIYKPILRAELENKLERFASAVEQIDRDGARRGTVSCSVGVLPVAQYRTMDEVYRAADRLLYQAKEQGRNRYIFGE